MQIPKTKHLTRYTYQNTAFQGWRVSITRNFHHFVRYVSDKACGGAEQSFAAALALRDQVLKELQQHPNSPQQVFDAYKSSPLPLRER